jgi:hypothetical protein
VSAISERPVLIPGINYFHLIHKKNFFFDALSIVFLCCLEAQDMIVYLGVHSSLPLSLFRPTRIQSAPVVLRHCAAVQDSNQAFAKCTARL